MSDELRGAVTGLLDEFLAGNREAVLEPSAADLIARAGPVGETDSEFAYYLGLFHHFRSTMMDRTSDATAESERALHFFRKIYRFAPDAVPEDLRKDLDASWQPELADLAQWSSRATTLLNDPATRFEQASAADAVAILTRVVEAAESLGAAFGV